MRGKQKEEMTPKQRAKIYRKAAEITSNCGFLISPFFALAGAGTVILNWRGYFEWPEVNTLYPIMETSAKADNKEQLILALLLCEQMCLNP